MKQSTFYYLLRRGVIGGGGKWAITASEFQTRVVSDGGTLESKSCLMNDIKYLVQNP